MTHQELNLFINEIESDIRNREFLKALVAIRKLRDDHGFESIVDDDERNESSLRLLSIEMGLR